MAKKISEFVEQAPQKNTTGKMAHIEAKPLADAVTEVKEVKADNTVAPLIANSASNAVDSFEIAASFVAPLLVDELRANGFKRPEAIGAKILGDLALFALPPTKVAGVAFKVLGNLAKAKKLQAAGNFLHMPYTDMKMLSNSGVGSLIPRRAAGQAASNAADNMVATGIQQAADTQELTIEDFFLEQGISGLLGGAIGFGAGFPSYGRTGVFESNLTQKTKAKPSSKKDREFEMSGRFDEMADAETNLDQALELIQKYGDEIPWTAGVLPPSWPTINKHINSKIGHWNTEAGKRAPSTTPKGNVKTVLVENDGFNNVTRYMSEGIPIKEPIFAKAAEKEKFTNNVNDFLETNNLGFYEPTAGKIFLNEGVSVAEAESILKFMRQGNFTQKTTKDWKEELRTALRNARGGEKYVKDLTDDGSYGAAMSNLERLYLDKNILNLTQGGYAYNQSPFGLKAQLHPSHRPGMGTIDTDLEIIPRSITQTGVNLYSEADDIKALNEKINSDVETFAKLVSELGEANPEVQRFYNEMSLLAKNKAAKVLNDLSGEPVGGVEPNKASVEIVPMSIE